MPLVSVFATILFLAIVVWIGGAITGQIMLARARDDDVLVVLLVEEVRWLITRVYIPSATIAFLSGLGLAIVTGTPLTAWYVAFPLVLYVVLALMGGAYSLPEYNRLLEAADQHGIAVVSDPEWNNRLWTTAWLNRVELALFALAIIGGIVQIAG
jgi:uncharacterized membrane protein